MKHPNGRRILESYPRWEQGRYGGAPAIDRDSLTPSDTASSSASKPARDNRPVFLREWAGWGPKRP